MNNPNRSACGAAMKYNGRTSAGRVSRDHRISSVNNYGRHTSCL